MTEIKPCRVCGSIPKLDKTRDGCNKQVTIRCKNYTAGILHEIQIVGESYDSTLEYWNEINEPRELPEWCPRGLK